MLRRTCAAHSLCCAQCSPTVVNSSRNNSLNTPCTVFSLALLVTLQVKQQLALSQQQAETATAAEAAARAELQVLQQQLEQHKEEARAQAEAFEAAKMQLLALKVKAAENREWLQAAGWLLQLRLLSWGVLAVSYCDVYLTCRAFSSMIAGRTSQPNQIA